MIFDKSLGLLERIFDDILEDQHIQEEAEKVASRKEGGQKVYRIGFYANEYTRHLEVMVEIFEDDVLY